VPHVLNDLEEIVDIKTHLHSSCALLGLKKMAHQRKKTLGLSQYATAFGSAP